MIIYNITFSIEKATFEEWKEWLSILFIPKMMATNCFTNYTWTRVIKTKSDDDQTHSIQFFAKKLTIIQQFIIKYEAQIYRDIKKKYDDKVLIFNTVMEVIDKK